MSTTLPTAQHPAQPAHGHHAPAEAAGLAAADVTRFSLQQRVEHFLMMTVFTTLAVTGFPQRWYEAAWSQAFINAIGGIQGVRWVHRVAGILFTLQTLWHLASSAWLLLRRRTVIGSIVPSRKDFRDVVGTLTYYLGTNKVHPRFDRYDYRQKFEYWGMVMGAFLMMFTGFVLLFPVQTTRLLPAVLVPASKAAHSSEGLMAFLVVIVWHIYNAHLSPDVFPFDKSIFTGKISRARMQHEHPLELERIDAAAAATAAAPEEGARGP